MILFVQKEGLGEEKKDLKKYNTKFLFSVDQRKKKKMLVKIRIKKILSLGSELTNTITCELVFRRRG